MKSERTIHRRKQDRAFKMEEFLYRRAVSGRLRPRFFVLFPWTGHRNFRLSSRRALPSSTTLHWLSCVPYSLTEKSRSVCSGGVAPFAPICLGKRLEDNRFTRLLRLGVVAVTVAATGLPLPPKNARATQTPHAFPLPGPVRLVAAAVVVERALSAEPV